MSRAAVSKSRADKGGKPPVAHTPVVAHEIVPGKFTDQDWSFMMDKDDSEEFVEKIMDELVDTTMKTIDDLYREKQLLPFTVTMAKDAILQIIEWQFLSRDEGEQNIKDTTDSGWMEDEEPDPAETDCWAQGSVPKNFLPPRPLSPVAETFDDKPDEDLLPEEEEEMPVVTEEEPAELEDKVSDTEQPDEVTEQTQINKEIEQAQKKKKKFKPYRGKIRSAPLKKLTESLEETEMKIASAEFESSVHFESTEKASELINMPASCHSIIKAQAGRPPGNKDVTYDEMGNVLAIIKFNPERLPSHRVKINYQVIDPTVEVAQARLEAMRHGRFISNSQKVQRRKLKKEELETTKEDKRSASTSTKLSKTPLPPPLIESMEIAAGITVKEGGRVKRGPPRYVRQGDMLTENRNLRPVGTRSSMAPQLEVSDLLDRHTPILRPIRDSPPLPPIVPHPPSQYTVTT